VLIEGMVASFVELDAIWQTVKDDPRGEVASDYAQGIRDNQVMLLSRIRKLAGADRADVLIKKAIRESRKRKPKRRNAAEVRPRGVEPSQHEPESGATGGAADVAVELNDSGDAHAERHAENTSDVTKKLFTPMPSNRVLTHELAIDKDYRLADSTETAALREDLYRSICSAMRQGFEDGSGGLWTLSAAENVREKLLRMLKPGNSMHTLISETLDLENISRQCQAGIFSYQGFFEFMANVLPKLCAPFRDQDIAALATELQQTSSDLGEAEQIDAMINKLFNVLRAVDLLSLDYTNFMIMNAAPMLIKEAAGYERRAFEQDLRNGKIDLSNTRRWWKSSLDQLNAEADRRDPEGLRLDRPKSNKVYAHGLVSLALDQTPQTLLEDHQWPETLHLDVERFSLLKRQAVRATVIGAILLTAKNLLKRDVRAQWKQQAGRMWALLSQEPFVSDFQNNDAAGADTTPSTADKAFAILETANNMPPATKLQVQNTISRFFAQAASASTSSSSLSSSSNTNPPSNGTTTPRFTDPVLKVLFHRLRTHLLSRLSATTSAERVRAASSANENLTSIGLGELSQHVAAMVDVLERVRRVDWEAHGFVYEGLVGEEMGVQG
ncbi:Tcp11-domain-containing protein, partial [Hortaea werneckii]